MNVQKLWEARPHGARKGEQVPAAVEAAKDVHAPKARGTERHNRRGSRRAKKG